MQHLYPYEQFGTKGRIDHFVLLSASPRRKELLNFLSPTVQAVDIDERTIEDTFMKQLENEPFLTRVGKTCCEISKAKANIPLQPHALYISADTMVVCDGRIYNKPADLDEAKQMLLSYFGKTHQVITSVCLKMNGYLDVFYCVANVTFVDYYAELDEVVSHYLRTKSVLDKSGAYGIQELDPRFVATISGDIHTIIGLPVATVCERIFR